MGRGGLDSRHGSQRGHQVCSPDAEHFADQAAYDAHTGSAAYKELIAGRFAGLITEFVEIDHELLVGI